MQQTTNGHESGFVTFRARVKVNALYKYHAFIGNLSDIKSCTCIMLKRECREEYQSFSSDRARYHACRYQFLKSCSRSSKSRLRYRYRKDPKRKMGAMKLPCYKLGFSCTECILWDFLISNLPIK